MAFQADCRRAIDILIVHSCTIEEGARSTDGRNSEDYFYGRK
ncbi:MAG: hypothetical protein ACE5FS_07525 [Paracoccaceae bacterium]